MEAVIDELKQNLPLKGLSSVSYFNIKHFVLSLKPNIKNPLVLNFILTIQQQDLQMELLFVWWYENKQTLQEIINSEPLGCLHAFKLILSRTHISVDNLLPAPNIIEMSTGLEYIILHPNIETFIKNDAIVLLATYSKTLHSDEIQRAINEIRINFINVPQNTPIPPNPLFVKNKIRTVYNDSQNVHNSTINESVIIAAKTLIKQTGAVLFFDNGYEIKTFLKDSIKTIIKRIKESYKIKGNVKILINNTPVTSLKKLIKTSNALHIAPSLKIDNSENHKEYKFFKNEESLYTTILGMDDIIFPGDIKRENEVGCRLNQVFIATNKLLHTVYEKNINDINTYLEFTGIENAFEIWEDRNIIVNELKKVYENEFIPNRISSLLYLTKIDESSKFIEEVFTQLFPYNEISSNFKKHVLITTVRDIYVLDLLNAVWKFIHSHKHKIELIKRLKEEIKDSFNVCSTGILARLINVIQGFTTDPLLTIKISIDDELKAKINEEIKKKCLKKQIDPIVNKDAFKIMLNKWICKNEKQFLLEFKSITSEYFNTFCTNMYL